MAAVYSATFVLVLRLVHRPMRRQIGLTPDTTTNGAVLSAVVGCLQKEIAASANTNNADYVKVG